MYLLYIQIVLIAILIFFSIMYLYYDRRVKKQEQKDKEYLSKISIPENYYLTRFYIKNEEVPVCLEYFDNYDVI